MDSWKRYEDGSGKLEPQISFEMTKDKNLGRVPGEQLNQELINKYNVPGPRYTSYPTVPYWDKIRRAKLLGAPVYNRLI